jgi:hypothetical protein
MKTFLAFAAFMATAVIYGFIEASNHDIPITASNFPWVSITIIVMLIVAWWLSRPKPDSDND